MPARSLRLYLLWGLRSNRVSFLEIFDEAYGLGIAPTKAHPDGTWPVSHKANASSNFERFSLNTSGYAQEPSTLNILALNFKDN